MYTNNVLALCPVDRVFWRNQAFSEAVAEHYPGAAWARSLDSLCAHHGIALVTGDNAIGLLRTKKISPSDVSVIQEADSPLGANLIYMGARPSVIFSYESPLYARSFYRNVGNLSRPFAASVLYEGFANQSRVSRLSSVAFFPSFSLPFSPATLAWRKRYFMAFVASNKYWNRQEWNLRGVASRLRNKLQPTVGGFPLATSQLQDKRLQLLQFFAPYGLDIYGANWNRLRNIPRKYREGLRNQKIWYGAINPGQKVKVELLSGYKFALCVENFSASGYVTEKVFDSLVAGAIPVYDGAPNIEDFVPKNCFVDVGDFDSFRDLLYYLQTMTDKEAEMRIAAGRDFLNSSAATRFTFDGVGKQIFDLAFS